MGIFSQKPKFKVTPPVLRVEKVLVDKPKPDKFKPRVNSLWPDAKARPKATTASGSGSGAASTASSASPRPSPLPAAARDKSKSASPLSTPSPYTDEPRLHQRKRKLVTRNGRSPALDRVAFDDDESGAEDDEGWKDALGKNKRRRRNGYGDDAPADLDRSLRHPEAFAPEGREEGEAESAVAIIHAVDVASLALGCAPALKLAEDEVAVELQYPGAQQTERYELVKGKDKIDAVSDVIEVVKGVADNYLADSDSAPFLDPSTGLIRQLERASSPNVRDAAAFKSALKDYNSRVLKLQLNGSIAAVLDQKHGVPLDLVQLILRQVYDRTVAPKVELLTRYQNGSDNVYGELNAPFASDILTRRTGMTSGQVFVDLGSGVGNVVLQAALQIGCESWGCEMMDNACALADAQLREFQARCRLWGLAPGRVRLERGDFRAGGAAVHEALKRADVVLVNNQAFTSQLNDDLVRMFLDLKPGCRVVSLKSFVHEHKGSSHNVNDVGSTILDVEDFTYPEGYVSWTGAGGTYCVSTRR